MLYSFDVFDTLITRNTATPEGIFAIMQKSLSDNCEIAVSQYVKNNFFQLRIGAEQVARNTYCRNGCEDVVLEQIYGVLVTQGHISEEASELLQNLEKETELKFVFGIQENIDRVKQLIVKGERVILISDMYLDQRTIHEMLCKVDGIFENIPLYVSSEEKKNKWMGDLYRLIQKREQVAYSEWMHMGDNRHSDVNVPSNLGIRCEWYQREGLLEIERDYLKNNEGKAEVQLAIGCAKNARIANTIEDIAYRLGCGIGGIVLYPYVKWLLQDSISKGITRLYFIARDGYVLKELADCLIKENGYSIETKYIYGSRRAWRVPSIDETAKDMWEIFEHSYWDRIMSAKELASFFDMPQEELEQYIPDGMKVKNIIWTPEVVAILVRQLLATDSFVMRLKERRDNKNDILVRYIQQELNLCDDKFAFVDLAGSGLTQECLAKVLRQFYNGKINNYFYRMDSVFNGMCENRVFYPNYVPQYVLLEMLCRAPHGQTIGYQTNEDGKIAPIFLETDTDAIKSHGIPRFIEGVKRFGMLYAQTTCGNEVLQEALSVVQHYLNYIYCSPDTMILDYFGDMPDMLTGRENSVRLYAPKLTNTDIIKLFLLRKSEPLEYFYNGVDFSYSLKRCSEEQHRKINFYKRVKEKCYSNLCRKIYELCREKKKTATVYDLVKHRIIIYGAGKKGKLFHRQITGKLKVQGRYYCSDVILWVDQNYETYQQSGYAIANPQMIYEVEYDQIVIAIARQSVAEEIENKLHDMGVPANKILWINPR